MKDSLFYIMESMACSGLFLAVYRSFIMRATGFRVSRFFLLLAMIGACTIPLLQIPVWSGQETSIVLPMQWNSQNEVSVVAQATIYDWNRWLVGIYVSGVVIMLVRMSLPLFRTLRLKHKEKAIVKGTYSLVTSKDIQNAFSSFRTVYLPIFENKEEEKLVLTHEESHLRHFHIAERWLMELLKAFCWFNPFAWIASRYLIEVQEMEADADVLKQGFDMTEYRQMLLKYAMGWEEWVCAFSPAFMKKRLLAMTEQRRVQNSRMWLMVPMLALGLVCFGFTIKPVSITDEVETNNEIVISGKVADEQTREPIVGAIIMETGSTKGIITDLKGEFRLKTEKGKELKFLMIDYKTRTFQVNELGESEEIKLTKTKK